MDQPDKIAAYLRHTARTVSQPPGAKAPKINDSDALAFQDIGDICRSGPPAEALALALALVRASPPELLEYITAGPLEDAVTYHASEIIDTLEVTARREPRVRQALGMIWLSYGSMPEPLLERIVRASNGAISPLGSNEKKSLKRRRSR